MDEIEREVLVLVGGESVAGTDGCFELLEAELISAEDRILVVLTVVGSEARTDCKRWQSQSVDRIYPGGSSSGPYRPDGGLTWTAGNDWLKSSNFVGGEDVMFTVSNRLQALLPNQLKEGPVTGNLGNRSQCQMLISRTSPASAR
ncbi:hypothetical protein MKW98_000196, partial [Papaver atlanticum]